MLPALVPELICSDIARSRAFYCDVLGFSVVYERPGERFVYLEREGAEIMLEQPLVRDRLFPEAGSSPCTIPTDTCFVSRRESEPAGDPRLRHSYRLILE